MSIIQFKEVNCKNCYKCIRSCPVEAITFSNDRAQIIEEECILCGKCLHVCPQNAKSVKNDVDKVRDFIEKKQKVFASVAPSFGPLFNLNNVKQLEALFKKLGFTHVEETAVGASIITPEYQKIIKEKKMKNVITTACPTIVNLIEKHYPDLIETLAPVVSPMVAHAESLKDKYGSRIKVVFIGPCLSKKGEARDPRYDKLIDAVITFEELEKWISEEGIDVERLDIQEDDNESYSLNTRYYPAPGGLIKALELGKKHNYKFVMFDGMESCVEILEQLRKGTVHDYFIEMNSCNGACLNGMCCNTNKPAYLEVRENLARYVNSSSKDRMPYILEENSLKLKAEYYDRSKLYRSPSEEEINNILYKIGKYSKEDELNCGACGYNTCREKAKAVINGKADLKMCLPFIRERAESMSNVVIGYTPNAIFVLHEDLSISELNPAAKQLFKISCEMHNRNIFEILNCPDIVNVSETKQNIYNSKYYYSDYDITVEQSIIYIKEHRMIMILMKDISKEEANYKQMYKVRCDTVDIAQRVIEKQMRVAQEIASLLGETTAETKVALTKLKKTIQSEMGENL